jgi:hypothetical protein
MTAAAAHAEFRIVEPAHREALPSFTGSGVNLGEARS